MSALEIENLCSGYGTIQILRGIDLNVKAGEFLGLWGHNGMGKSTLMRTILGYLPAQSGSVVFNSDDITRMPTHQRARLGIGLVPQGREIFPTMSVLDNLRMGCTAQRAASTNDHEATIHAVLRHFPRLEALLDRNGGLLSGGEQQLLALARCLCGKPSLMLLDEPTEGIQPSIIAEMVDTLRRIRDETGLTMVVVEQNQEFIAALSDRVVIMQRGQLVRERSPMEFLKDAEFV
jgi:branched-chain amino acid transport system ATP-binding protein